MLLMVFETQQKDIKLFQLQRGLELQSSGLGQLSTLNCDGYGYILWIYVYERAPADHRNLSRLWRCLALLKDGKYGETGVKLYSSERRL